MEKTNVAAYTLSHHPHNPDLESEKDNEDDEYETILYSTVCQLLGEEILGWKLDRELKLSIQEEERRNCTVGITSGEVKVLDNTCRTK